MKLKVDGTLLKNCIAPIEELINEVQFKAEPEQLSVIDMDPANVAMVIFRLPKASCIEYDVEKEEKFGLNLANFTAILKRAAKDDFIVLETKEGKMNIKISGNFNREFKMPLLEIDKEEDKEQKEPELKTTVKMDANTKIITDSIKDVELVSESAAFEVSAGHLALTGEGDLSSVRVDMDASDALKIEGEIGDKIRSKYAIEYLMKMLKPSVSKEIKVELAKDYPLRITYKNDGFFLRYILAPRVENE